MDRGFLRIGRVKGHPCFAVTEPDGRTAAARRLDGELFERQDGTAYKAHALTGKSWPLGFGAVPSLPDLAGAVMLCEGETDFLAPFHFIAQWNDPRL